MVERSILLFESGVKSPKTLQNYTDHLNRFMKFTKIKDYDTLASMNPGELQTIVEDYVMDLKKSVSPNSVGAMISGVKHFFVMNRILLNWDIIRKMYPAKVKLQGFKAWQTSDIKKMLDSTTSLRNKALIHFMASTGCRVGAFENLKMKHLEDMGDGCKGVLLYEGSKEEYWSFLTPEASQALDNYFEERLRDKEEFTDDSPIFRIVYQLAISKVKPLRVDALRNLMYRIINTNVTIKRTKIHNNYDIQIDHGFRKRFNTILKLENSVNANIAEKIMGHKNGLDGVYLAPTKEQCFAEFKKAIPNLTIDDSERLRIENKNLTARNTVIEQKNLEIAKLTKKFEADHIIVNEFAKLMHKAGFHLENPDGTPYEIDYNLKIPPEYLPEPEVYDKSLVPDTNRIF